MKLLIDGYNLIPAIPELGRVLRKDLEQGREGIAGIGVLSASGAEMKENWNISS